MDNNDYTITRSNGARYQYDADFDMYMRIPEPVEETHMLRWGWAYICLLTLVLSAYITYRL